MDSRPTVLSLCAGIGGLDLAVRRVFPASRLVCAVEVEAFPAAVLAHQMAQGAMDAAPIWSDLRTFDARAWRGCVDILTAGFPCQPFSVAGKRGGDTDQRHLWPHVRRVINGARPRLVFLENVPGLLTVRCAGGRTAYELVRSELQRLAYRVEAVLVTASEVGAPHKRERLFILGVSDTEGWIVCQPEAGDRWTCAERGGITVADAESGYGRVFLQPGRQDEAVRQSGGASGEVLAYAASGGETVGHAEQSGLEGQRWHGDGGHESRLDEARSSRSVTTSGLPVWPPSPTDTDAWRDIIARWPDLAPALESGVRGLANGVSTRVDELRAYGNAVVPAQGAYALRLLLGGEA